MNNKKAMPLRASLMRLAQRFSLLSLIVLFGLTALMSINRAEAAELDAHALRFIPIQYQGRVMPFESFSRNLKTLVQSKELFSSSNTLDSSMWAAELILDPQSAYQRKDFKVSKILASVLELTQQESDRYTFTQMVNAITRKEALIDRIIDKESLEPNQLSELERQLLTLYHNTLTYFEISRSLSLLLPLFEIDDNSAEQLGLTVGSYTFLALQAFQQQLADHFINTLNALSSAPKNDQIPTGLAKIQLDFSRVASDQHTRLFRVIPIKAQTLTWHAPWELWAEGLGTPQTAPLMRAWKNLALAFRNQDQPSWDQALAQLAAPDLDLALMWRTQSEAWYHLLEPLKVAFVFYLLALLGLCWRKCRLTALPVIFKTTAVTIHFLAICARILILQRPPVATLYESILFVAFVVALSGLILFKRNQGVAALSIIGALALLFIASGFSTDGDTMFVLVAVLDSNFWLTTHVLIITAGYAFCILASTIAHGWVIFESLANRTLKRFSPAPTKTSEKLFANLHAMTLIALFLVSLGTILGGIWADQSWGRFWGWDPKENGALLIVLWLAFLLHARIGKLVGTTGFCFGMMATNIVVAISWFGVNLLNIGLHSYGFTKGLSTSLGSFIAAELLLISVFWYRLHAKTKVRELIAT